MPKLCAIVSCPSRNVYQVVFYYVTPEGGTDKTLPEITIPATSYDHARATVEAFNAA